MTLGPAQEVFAELCSKCHQPAIVRGGRDARGIPAQSLRLREVQIW